MLNNSFVLLMRLCFCTDAFLIHFLMPPSNNTQPSWLLWKQGPKRSQSDSLEVWQVDRAWRDR